MRQRLRLASVSPRLLAVYAEDGMTLDQLMAFTVGSDHERQEEVWEAVQRSHNKEPYQIRRFLTEGAVRASDKRAQFAGPEYEAAGGAVMRDLFQHDDGGWLQDPGLLDRLVMEKLEREAGAVRAEGWKWVEVATDFPYGHTFGQRRLSGDVAELTDEEVTTHAALKAEYEQLEETYAQVEDLPDEVDQRLGEIETALEAFHTRPVVFAPDDVPRAGAFVSLDPTGSLRVERGYVRPEDEPAPEEKHTDESNAMSDEPEGDRDSEPGGQDSEPPEEDEGLRPLPDRLMTELTAHRTLALRDALAADPDTAFLAMLHVLCLKLFYRHGLDSCLEVEAKCVTFSQQAPGLADSPSAQAIDACHQAWADQLPGESAALWEALAAFDHDSRQALFAHCVGQTLNAVYEAWNRRPKALAHADRLASVLGLDIAGVGWVPTVDNFLGRVTKAQILLAVQEAQGQAAAQRIGHLKKGDMAREAEQMLAGSGWLPEPLRTASLGNEAIAPPAEIDGEQAIDAPPPERDAGDRQADPHAFAAE
ncbi:MAG: chromosome partitioning protein ParB [Phenylobacterium sp.]